MSTLPNPWTSASEAVVMPVADQAAAFSPSPPASDAAATPIDDHRFVLDEQAFMEAIEPLPLFLQAPLDVMNVLSGYAR